MRHVFEVLIKPIIRAIYLTVRRAVLTIIGLLFLQKKSFDIPENIGNILFIRVDRVGDMVLSTPAYEAIKAAYPRARLTVMASKTNALILENNPHVDEIIVYDRIAPLLEKMRFLKGLRTRHFDLAIDPFDDYELETAWIAWMSGANYRVGYEAYGREVFFNVSMQRSVKEKHFIDITLDLLKVIGVSYHARQPAIYLDEPERSWAAQWIKKQGLQDRMLIALHPGAYYETQRWPPEYFADLINMIHKRKEAEIILFGAPTDTGLIANIQARAQKSVPVSIEPDIRRFLALLSYCRILVCNNSGPLHCAVALDVPTISFMGPTIKARWAPVGGRHRVLRQDDLPCIGCNLGYCRIKTHECMRWIEPAMVIRLIWEELLDEIH